MNNTKQAKVNKYGQLMGYFSELGSIHQFLKDEEGGFSKDELMVLIKLRMQRVHDQMTEIENKHRSWELKLS
ncbi:hypothetical protein AAGG74_14940 [Bacillus mexicanus]|uniref:hypothetical protein n=1 Tax=Bacillus mexicanus TaxID=2834415 RepID=UPI003D21BE67